MDAARAGERKSLVGSGDRSERIRTYNFPQGRVTDHRINLTLYKLDRIISGDDLGEIVDALVAQDQADRLAEFEAAETLERCVERLRRRGATRLGARPGVEQPARRGAAAAGACAGRRRRDELLSGIAAASTPEQAAAVRSAGRAPRRARAVAYITGRKEFWSLDFAVGPGVLVPRPETETLIEEALRHCPGPRRAAATSPISAPARAPADRRAEANFPTRSGIGFEASPEALALGARQCRDSSMPDRAEIRLAGTGATLDGPVRSDLLQPALYPAGDIAGWRRKCRAYEPRAALDGGPDGLDAYRALAELLPRLLKPGGHGLPGNRARARTRRLRNSCSEAGLGTRRIAPDLAGIRALCRRGTQESG